MENSLVKTKKDEREAILALLSAESPTKEEEITSHLLLKDKLANCEIISNGQVPENVISLGKIFAIKMSFGSKSGLKLVTPDQAEMAANKVSVLSPLGCALYGRKAGDRVQWQFNNFVEEVEILSVREKRGGILSIFL